MLFPPVGQVIRPRLPGEGAARLGAGVAAVHLLVALEFTGEAEPHGAALGRAPVLGQVRVLLAHVGLQQLVLPELQAAALVRTEVSARAVAAADVALPVGVGGESLGAALHGAGERFVSVVDQLMTRQMVRAAERLPAALVSTRVRLHSGVFT